MTLVGGLFYCSVSLLDELDESLLAAGLNRDVASLLFENVAIFMLNGGRLGLKTGSSLELGGTTLKPGLGTLKTRGSFGKWMEGSVVWVLKDI